jgi:hypothetical protein
VRSSVAIELTSVGTDASSDTLAAVPVWVIVRIGKIDVDSGSAPATHATEAVATETAMGDVIFIAVDGTEAFGDVTAAVAALVTARAVHPHHGRHTPSSSAGHCSRSSSIGSPQNSQHNGSRTAVSDTVIGSHPSDDQQTAAMRPRTRNGIGSLGGGSEVAIWQISR